VHEVTASCTPQHNVIAERRNKTGLNLARSILRDFGEKQFRKIKYILNRSPTKKLHQLMKLGLEASQV